VIGVRRRGYHCSEQHVAPREHGQHPDTLTSMRNLAISWRRQGQYSKALKPMEECVQLQTRVMGINNPYTIASSTVLTKWKTGKLNINTIGARKE
jgi:hypothetical protein